MPENAFLFGKYGSTVLLPACIEVEENLYKQEQQVYRHDRTSFEQ